MAETRRAGQRTRSHSCRRDATQAVARPPTARVRETGVAVSHSPALGSLVCSVVQSASDAFSAGFALEGALPATLEGLLATLESGKSRQSLTKPRSDRRRPEVPKVTDSPEN